MLTRARPDRNIIQSNVDQTVEVGVWQREGQLGAGLEVGEGHLPLGPVIEIRPQVGPVYPAWHVGASLHFQWNLGGTWNSLSLHNAPLWAAATLENFNYLDGEHFVCQLFCSTRYFSLLISAHLFPGLCTSLIAREATLHSGSRSEIRARSQELFSLFILRDLSLLFWFHDRYN